MKKRIVRKRILLRTYFFDGWLESELLADVLGDGVLVDGIIHRVGCYEGLGHVPDSLVVTRLAPRVLLTSSIFVNYNFVY